MAASKNSLVAYFDILGYQSFLNNNSAVEMAEQVIKIVKQAPAAAVTDWSDWAKDLDDWKLVAPTIKSLVFSDTIIVSCPIQESGPTAIQTALIAGIAASIARTMFEDGLPIRGAITFGSFIFDETCIAGRSIIEAHKLCQTLDLAGIAFTPKMSEFMDENLLDWMDNWNEHFPYYLFPLKNQSELKMRSILYIWDTKDDFTTEVRKAFWKWNKDIPLSVDCKVRNTAKMLDFFRMHFQNFKQADKESALPAPKK